MKRIGLMSDTHSHLDQKVFEHFAECDEIWHAGDFGNMELVRQLEAFKPLRGVYGNIDGADIRAAMPLDLRFECAGVAVFMTHIGGYPGRYEPRVRKILQADPPRNGLFISGHSHILKIMPDPQLGFLHINPGACGHEGWHKVKTLVRFTLEEGLIRDLQIIEIGSRGIQGGKEKMG
ncbi:MAG: metallophosphoesterase family protein [Saprospiraceae bacterium]|nr:metallophosphoesterase family protein [Saprospiraceae bacterium]